jgi:hypothetical protein
MTSRRLFQYAHALLPGMQPYCPSLRIERAHSDRARSASKKDGWLLTSFLSSLVPLRGWLRAF